MALLLPHFTNLIVGYYLLAFSGFTSSSAEVYSPKDVIDHSIPEYDTVLTEEDLQNVDDFQTVDLKTVLPIEQHQKLDTYDPTLRAGKFEGDIENYTPEELAIVATAGIQVARSAVRRSWQLWPNKEIPYVLSSRYGKYSRRAIAKGMRQFQSKSCVRFVPHDKQKDYIYIYPDDGCYSLVGRVGGRQPVSLDEGCLEGGTIVHELMHAVGFFHEQSRNDRDDYIKINWPNIMRDAEDQFDKYSLNTISHLDLPYDYGSVMHYGPYAFSRYPYSKSGKTIEVLKSGGHNMGQRKGFSDMDLKKLNKLYTCTVSDIEANQKKPDTSPGLPDRGTGTSGTGGGSGTKRANCKNRGWFCSVRMAIWSCKDRDIQSDCEKSCDLCTSQDNSGLSVVDFGSDSHSVIIQTENTGKGGGAGGASGGGSGAPCEDASGSDCVKWKARGHCETHLGYMMRKCLKSCTGCGTEE